MAGIRKLMRTDDIKRYCLVFGLSCCMISHCWGESGSRQTLQKNNYQSIGGISANARRLVLDGDILPASSFYVPNSFVNSGRHRFYGFLHGISRVRNRNLTRGCAPDCSDAIAYVEADIWKNPTDSFTMQFSLHSLTGRNGCLLYTSPSPRDS